jgi:hypothetical protein
MKAKTIITGVLLLFVCVSLIYIFVGESGREQVSTEAHNQTDAQENSSVDGESSEPVEPEPQVIAYYFHGNKRCNTCRTIEAYAEESIRTGFARELETGMLEWRVVNVEESGNEHFVQDYQLSTRSVVLVDMRDEKQTRWKNLARTWELVREKQAFVTYIQEETQGFLGGQDG